LKIAILSDIHGNNTALEAVLKDLQQRGDADHLLVSGDMFAFGPTPKEVLSTLQDLDNARHLLGNTERYFLEGNYPITPNSQDWQERLLRSFNWTAERLGREGLRFIERLPHFQVMQDGDRQLMAVHGSPRSDEEGLTLRTGDRELGRMPIDTRVAVLACGHTHIPMDRVIGGVRVVNAGSVGLPFDGDPRAGYALISGLAADGDDSIRVEIRRISYDVEKVVAQCFTQDHPASDIHAYNLRTARSRGSSLIYTQKMRNGTN
jgi:putative phosphoesterase